MREVQDNVNIRAAPAIYRLIRVSDCVNCAVIPDKITPEQECLCFVHVLILIDEQPTNTILFSLRDSGVFLHHHERQNQEVVKVYGVELAQSAPVFVSNTHHPFTINEPLMLERRPRNIIL